MPTKTAKRPDLAPASRYEVLTATNMPGTELTDARILPISLIDHNPYQARQAFDLVSLQQLADTITEYGVLQPILVRPVGERYELVAGERRYRAALMAELVGIPAHIQEMDSREAAIVTALENLQREDLDIEDEARQFAYLCETLEISQRELARKLGKNHLYISRRIKLLKHPELMEAYRTGKLVMLEAAALAGSSEDEEEEDVEAATQGDTLPTSDGQDAEYGGGHGDIRLVERTDLPGYLVERGETEPSTSGSRNGTQQHKADRSMFRWRPLQTFQKWVLRTPVSEIPPDERFSMRAQLLVVKETLEARLAELDLLEEESPEEAVPDSANQPLVAEITSPTK